MSNITIAITWLKEHNHGNSLTDGDIVRTMHDEFQKLRRDNEHLLCDYDTLEICHTFGITDPTMLEMCISDVCGGQCLAGAEMEAKLQEAVTQLHAQGQHEMANLMQSTIGGLYYYSASLLNTITRIFGDVSEITVRRLVRFVMGHERQHEMQTLSFIEEGRSIEQTQMLCTNADDIEDISICAQYAQVPSEMEADENGLLYMLSFE